MKQALLISLFSGSLLLASCSTLSGVERRHRLDKNSMAVDGTIVSYDTRRRSVGKILFYSSGRLVFAITRRGVFYLKHYKTLPSHEP